MNVIDVLDRDYAWSIPFDDSWAIQDRLETYRQRFVSHPTKIELSHDGTKVALAYGDHVHVANINFETQSMDLLSTYTPDNIAYRSETYYFNCFSST